MRNTPINKFKYEITDGFGNRAVYPLGEADFSIEYTQDQDETKRFYSKEFGGRITFSGEAFKPLYIMEQQREIRCLPILITIFKPRKGQSDVVIYSGSIFLNDGDWDLDNCKVIVKFSDNDGDSCYEANKGKEIDVFELVGNQRETVTILGKNSTVEIIERKLPEQQSGWLPDDQQLIPYWGTEGDPTGWTPVKTIYFGLKERVESNSFYQRVTHWARYISRIRKPDSLGYPWQLIEETATERVYVRELEAYGCKDEVEIAEIPFGSSFISNTRTCRYVGDSIGASERTFEYRNGLKLQTVLQAVVSSMCNNLTVRSDFFKINSTDEERYIEIPYENLGNGSGYYDLDGNLVASPDFKRFIIPADGNASYVASGQMAGANPRLGLFIYFDSEMNLIGSNGNFSMGQDGNRFNRVSISAGTSLMPAATRYIGMSTKNGYDNVKIEELSTVNYVTGQKSQTDNIIVFQKSDVKRPTATEQATKMKITPEKFIDALCHLFNLKWDIQDGFFVIEHVSRFSRELWKDLTTEENKKYLEGKRKYTYEGDKVPSRETIRFDEEPPTGDFRGVPIEYSGGCVTAGRGAEKTINIEQAGTDVMWITDNGSRGTDNVSDNGVVFMATENIPSLSDDGSTWIWQVLNEPRILDEGNIPNNVMSISHLMDKYYPYNRPLTHGIMNNRERVFKTTQKLKKGVPIKIPFCWEEKFNPNVLIRTMFGDGDISKATYDFLSSTITVELDYYSEPEMADMPIKTKDIAKKQSANWTETYDLSEAVTEYAGGSPIASVEIIVPPLYSTVASTNGRFITVTTGIYNTRGLRDVLAFQLTDVNGNKSAATNLALDISTIVIIPTT